MTLQLAIACWLIYSLQSLCVPVSVCGFVRVHGVSVYERVRGTSVEVTVNGGVCPPVSPPMLHSRAQRLRREHLAFKEGSGVSNSASSVSSPTPLPVPYSMCERL